VARRHGAWILVASTAEVSPDPARPFNSSALIAPDVSVAAAIAKVHLFDLDVVAGPADTQSARVTAGTGW
jgi:predicted amidohydrolase